MKSIFTIVLLCFASLIHAQTFELYVSDAGNFNNPPWQILKYDGNGQNPTTFINANLNWPQDILFLEDSNTVLISNLGSNRITRHNAATGAYISDFANGIGGGPTRIKIGWDGLLYVLQWGGSGFVWRYQLDGTYMGSFTSVGVPQAIGMDWDSERNLYVSSYNGDYVRKFDSLGNDLGIFVNSNLLGPTNIWFDSDGDLLVSDYNGTAVKRFDTAGTYMGDFITGLGNSEGVDFFPNGNILIGNGVSSSVKMYDSAGAYISDIVPSGSGGLLTPNAVVIREVTPLAVEEPVVTQQLVSPSIGRQFYIQPTFLNQLSSLEVFDISGKQIGEVEGGVWRAGSHPDGIYFMVGRLVDGTVLTQKVLVRK